MTKYINLAYEISKLAQKWPGFLRQCIVHNIEKIILQFVSKQSASKYDSSVL